METPGIPEVADAQPPASSPAAEVGAAPPSAAPVEAPIAAPVIAPMTAQPAPHAPHSDLLAYAPPPPARRTPVYVILWGLFSTAVALTALHFIQEHVGTDIMSFTLRLIFPVGALAVGFVAGLGYGISAYVLNVRVRSSLIWLIVLLQVWAYFAGHFIEFKAAGPLIEKSTNTQVGFFRYYHLTTIYMTRVEDGPGGSGRHREQLGATGYFYRGLGILGFVFGGVIIPLIQRTLPYCPLCQRYMKTKNLLTLPATARLARVRIKGKFKLDTPEQQAAFEQAMTTMKELVTALTAGDVPRVRELMQRKQKVPGRVPLYAAVDLQYCRQCFQGTYAAALKNNNNYQTALAGVVAKGDVIPEVVQSVVDPTAPVPPIATAPIAAPV